MHGDAFFTKATFLHYYYQCRMDQQVAYVFIIALLQQSINVSVRMCHLQQNSEHNLLRMRLRVQHELLFWANWVKREPWHWKLSNGFRLNKPPWISFWSTPLRCPNTADQQDHFSYLLTNFHLHINAHRPTPAGWPVPISWMSNTATLSKLLVSET